MASPAGGQRLPARIARLRSARAKFSRRVFSDPSFFRPSLFLRTQVILDEWSRGDRAYISGHGPQEPDGSLAGPFGAVGESVSLDEARASARKVGLSMLGSLKRELGSPDRITGWCRVHGMANAAPGFTQTPAVMNGFSDLILEVFRPEVGRHAHTAFGVAALPFNLPVEIEAEVIIGG